MKRTCGSKGMSCGEFVGLMRDRGYTYDAQNGGFKTAHGKKAGKAVRNGYRTLSLQKGKEIYTFCEHRCVYVWFNGDIADGYEINHIDFDRSNNKIENLEAVTHSENIRHSVNAGHCNWAQGEKSPKTTFTNREAQAMRELRKHGWSIKQIKELFGGKYENSIGRIISGARFGSVPDAQDVISIYPAIVYHTMNWDLLRHDLFLNAATGLCGECGEIVDLIKKAEFQGHNLDVDALNEELGDLLYYITLVFILIEGDLSDTMFNNWDKLIKRYPQGFRAERSINREE